MAWILSVLVAIVILAAACGAVFALAVSFDELSKYTTIAYIGRAIVLVCGAALIIGAIAGTTIIVHRTFEHNSDSPEPIAVVVDTKPIVDTPAASKDAGTDSKLLLLEHIIDGREDNIKSHRWFELYADASDKLESNKWRTINADLGAARANLIHASHPGVTMSLATYIRNGSGEYVLVDYSTSESDSTPAAEAIHVDEPPSPNKTEDITL